ncbi:MAG: hypothetical protein R3C40_06915 [Parvularculaceae bacterium]
MYRKLAVIGAFCAALFASASAEIIAIQTVEKEVMSLDAQGRETTSRIAAQMVTPGETVVYSLSFKNASTQPAEDLVLVMPVPDAVVYVEGSVEGAPASISFSADGGETYVARGRLTIVENGEPRAARGDEITHIKWTLSAPVAPEGEGWVSYKGVLR